MRVKPEYTAKADTIDLRAIPSRDMALRDWFAGQAISGAIIASRNGHSVCPYASANFAYQVADALLSARMKNNG
jgi:hypothetical protein